MIFASVIHLYGSVQTDQVIFFIDEHFSCFGAEIAVSIMTVENGFTVFLTDIDQAFLTFIVVSRNGNDFPAI